VKETAPTAARDWMLDAIKQAEEAEKKSEFHRDRIMEYAEAINSPSDGRKTVITFDQIFEAAEAGSARVRAAALFFTLVGWSGQINRDYDPRRYMHLFEDQRELQHRG
jgi:anaerobic selenocysteine-containing dehydrogenase